MTKLTKMNPAALGMFDGLGEPREVSFEISFVEQPDGSSIMRLVRDDGVVIDTGGEA